MAQTRAYTHRERRLRQRLLKLQDPCGICGQPIDYALPQYHPLSFEVDHIVPVSHGGEHTLDNVRATHRKCNRQRSNTIDADAIAAGAEPTIRTTSGGGQRKQAQGHSCPPGPCERHGTHHEPASGVEFITSRHWTP